MKPLIKFVFSLLPVFFAAFTQSPTSTTPIPFQELNTTTTTTITITLATVKRVIDGDTIELADGKKVRYIGMDTPETVDPRKPVQCYGKIAKAYNQSLVAGKKVRLEKDVSETDKYHRLLRYVYLADGTMVNEKLVVEGYARVMTIPPDVRFSSLFLKDEQAAQKAQRGLWAACQ